MMAEAGAAAFSPGPQDSGYAASPHPAPVPGAAPTTPAGLRLGRVLPIAGLLAIVVIAAAVIFSLHLGGPATASDGSFSVKNPGGWYPTTWSVVRGYPVVLALQAVKNGGVSEFAVTDLKQQVPIEDIPAAWEQLGASGQIDSRFHLGAMSPTTVGGAPAEAGEITGAYTGQLIFVNYNNRTYLVAIASTNGTYSRMRDTDFAIILSSWTWLH